MKRTLTALALCVGWLGCSAAREPMLSSGNEGVLPMDGDAGAGDGADGVDGDPGADGRDASGDGADASGDGADASGDGSDASGDGADASGDGGSDGPVSTSNLRLDAVQMRGTHNSYHKAPAVAFDASHEYTHVPLDQQLADQGVRVFELDLHRANTDDSIDVYHITTIDSGTTCLNFEDCLRTIRAWSDAHPSHAPILVWMEMKDSTGGPAFDDLGIVDEVIRAEVGDRLLTPDDIQGSAASLHDALVTNGWPKVDDVRGMIAFIVLSDDSDIDQYSAGYTTLAGRAMFVRVNEDKFTSPVAAFCKLGATDSTVIQAAHDAKLMIATNVCAINDEDDACEQTRVAAIANGIHMLKDDIPAPLDGRTYYMALPEGKPVACNPVRAPDDCTAEALESL